MTNWNAVCEASQLSAEEFALGIDPKSLHATVLMQMVYNAVIQHSRGFLKHVAISVVKKGKDNSGVDWVITMLLQWHKLGYKSSILDLDFLTWDLNLTWGELVVVITGEGRGLYIQIPELHCTIRQKNDAIWQDKKLHQLNDKAQECRILMEKLGKNGCAKIGVKLWMSHVRKTLSHIKNNGKVHQWTSSTSLHQLQNKSSAVPK